MFRLSSLLSYALLALPLVAALPGPTCAAQAQFVVVNIPFNFSANDQHLPAGRYRISLESSGRYLSFLNMNTAREQYLMVLPASVKNTKVQGRLLFRRYGDANYLSQAWMPGQGEGREFIRSHGEQEILREMKHLSAAEVQIPLGPATQQASGRR